ncbi:MAG: ABC transporter permease subunit, partial [Ruthenibacterium lactatiformans]
MENFWNDLNKLLSDFYKVTVYKGRWVQYLEGLGMTIALAALACLIGVCIGVLVALVKYYAGGKKSFGWKTVNAACGIYVTVIRGTPIVVQLLIAYTILFNGSFEACVFAFGVNSGAYVAEIIRGGIASIDPGQAEAGRSLGLSESAT